VTAGKLPFTKSEVPSSGSIQTTALAVLKVSNLSSIAIPSSEYRERR
jgi:hypothetical protein